ncbi:hypothetical protein RJZ56_005465 [Blastomyces dermatitidis]|uniref:Heat shock factor binding protein 1 n=3 Tax=Blastomyces TaxID=229219 RepID=A0A179UZK7_BLAGS|nr:uncharacterized protein BDBG_07824 [Blastomyces gilchristii SLH14081]XP_031580408.1 hypothetical protein, variant [Blastomyces gilchristii SLH14081]XP_045276860.1 uncharacterized protein BDCG_05172 [Blastomyces dermatitidis ER-3]XP_045281154.1 hypothetical protein, variant [Blastomyces dermatitidis ER-3]EGE83681.1 hypothetical protein BDDG_06626 [Blastomyces dermatitidis ATCC 18188]EQL30332.1 hypothetical protein BDFG_07164 [Blastomyces dermatitidis ATCC 26199]EEQ90052.1 hypothetical prote
MSTLSRRPSQLRSNSDTDNNKRSSIQAATTAGDESSNQLVQAVDELLDQLQNKFDKVSKEIFGKLDDMARRLDQLEAALASSPEANTTN